MNETKVEYIPIPEIEYRGRFVCDEVRDDRNGFSILVTEYSGKRYLLMWPEGVKAYRKSDESDRLRLLECLGNLGLLGNLIIECKNSSYIQWLSEDKYNIVRDDERHFVVLTSNDIIDVIDYDYPSVLES